MTDLHNHCPAEDNCPWFAEVLALRQTVVTDPLTSLFNVRHFKETLPQEMERTRRNHSPTALLMLDLDHFKHVNDTYGHEAGNQVLKCVAAIIKHNTRTLDTACRYGGEEFVLILPSTHLAMAVNVGERIIQDIRQTDITLDSGRTIHVTCSVGISVFEHHHPQTQTQLIEHADQHLYAAKQAGRDRVSYDVPKPPESAVNSDERGAISSLFGGSDDD